MIGGLRIESVAGVQSDRWLAIAASGEEGGGRSATGGTDEADWDRSVIRRKDQWAENEEKTDWHRLGDQRRGAWARGRCDDAGARRRFVLVTVMTVARIAARTLRIARAAHCEREVLRALNGIVGVLDELLACGKQLCPLERGRQCDKDGPEEHPGSPIRLGSLVH